MRSKDELKKWITDTKKEVLDSENNYMFFLVQPDTIESILVILDEFMQYLDLNSNMTETLKAVLGHVRLQDESDPNQTVRRIIEKIEKGETIDGTDEHI